MSSIDCKDTNKNQNHKINHIFFQNAEGGSGIYSSD